MIKANLDIGGYPSEITFSKAQYRNGGLAIMAWDYDGQYCTMTTWLPKTDILNGNEAFMNPDDDCMAEIVKWLEKMGYATPIPIMATSGFNTYTAYEFSEEFLREI